MMRLRRPCHRRDVARGQQKDSRKPAPGGLVRLMGYFRYVDMAIYCERRRRAVSVVTHVLGLSVQCPCVCVRDTTAVAVGSAAVGRAYSHDCTSNIDNVDTAVCCTGSSRILVRSVRLKTQKRRMHHPHSYLLHRSRESQPACSVHTVCAAGSHSRWYGVVP